MLPLPEAEETTNSRHLLAMDLLGLSAAIAGSLTLNLKGAGVVVRRVTLEASVPNLPPSERQMVERFPAIMKELMNDL